MIPEIAITPSLPLAAQQGSSAGGGPFAVHQPGRGPEPGSVRESDSGAEADRAAEEGSRGRVADSKAATSAQQDGLAKELTPEQLRILEQLEQTDREVRQHELAHQIAGGPYTGSARYQYEIGPDGQRYAVAGRVSVDYGPVTGDPRATVEKMNTVIAAALAPADPSPADYQIAARARQNLLLAQLELSQQQGRSSQVDGAGAATEGRNASATASANDPRVEEYRRTAEADNETRGIEAMIPEAMGAAAAVGSAQGTLQAVA
jgi:hypothetical protein